jgi:hypothetical protein
LYRFVLQELTDDAMLTMVLYDFETDPSVPFTCAVPINSIADIVTLCKDRSAPVNPNAEVTTFLQQKFGNLPSVPSQCFMSFSYLLARILPELAFLESITDVPGVNATAGLRVKYRSVGLPIGAGLGSSAAVSVAVAGALLRLRMKLLGEVGVLSSHLIVNIASPLKDGSERKLSYDSLDTDCPHWFLATVNAWAYASEVVIHGTPSGLDNTTSCYGGAMKYSKVSGQFEQLDKLPPLNVVLTNTKVPRSTKLLVAGVRVKYDKYPDVIKPVLDSIEAISRRFLTLVEQYVFVHSCLNNCGNVILNVVVAERTNRHLKTSLTTKRKL